MAKFNEYTQKATPEDNDTLMIYDNAAKANKLSPFSGIWNWMVGKLTNAVIANLQTNNKTVLGAINELNSNTSKLAFWDCTARFEYHEDRGLIYILDALTQNYIRIDFDTKIKTITIQKSGEDVGIVKMS